VLWIAAGIGMLVCNTAKLWEVRAAQTRLQTLTVHCRPLRRLEDAMRREQVELAGLRIEELLLESLQPLNRHVAALGVLTQAVRPEQGKLQIQKLNWLTGQSHLGATASTAAVAPPSGTATTTRAHDSVLFLQGVAHDDAVLARFVTNLHNAGVFRHIDLKSSSHIPDGGGFARQFHIECRCEEQP